MSIFSSGLSVTGSSTISEGLVVSGGSTLAGGLTLSSGSISVSSGDMYVYGSKINVLTVGFIQSEGGVTVGQSSIFITAGMTINGGLYCAGRGTISDGGILGTICLNAVTLRFHCIRALTLKIIEIKPKT